MPGAPIASHEQARGLRPPTARRVVVGDSRTKRRRCRPEQRLDGAPRRLDLLAILEEALVPAHRVEHERSVGLRLRGAAATAEVRFHLEHLERERRAGRPARDTHPHPARGRDLDDQPIRARDAFSHLVAKPAEEVRGRSLELDDDLGALGGKAFAGPQVERRARPAPVVEVDLHRREGLGGRASGDAGGLRIAGRVAGGAVLPKRREPLEARRKRRLDRLEDVPPLGTDAVCGEDRRRLHRDEGEHLQQVRLDHVADGAGLVVERDAILDPERLRGGDLDMVDEPLVPERLEDPVREAHRQQPLHRLLPEVVVDAVDLLLVEDRGELPIERLRGRLVDAEGLLDDDATPWLVLAVEAPAAFPRHEPAVADRRDDRRIELGRDREEEQHVAAGAFGRFVADALRNRLPCFGLRRIAGLVADPRRERLPGCRIEVRDPRPDRLGELLSPRRILLGPSAHAEDADLRRKVAGDMLLVERGEKLAAREIAGGAEDDEEARVGRGHSRSVAALRRAPFEPARLRIAASSSCSASSQSSAALPSRPLRTWISYARRRIASSLGRRGTARTGGTSRTRGSMRIPYPSKPPPPRPFDRSPRQTRVGDRAGGEAVRDERRACSDRARDHSSTPIIARSPGTLSADRAWSRSRSRIPKDPPRSPDARRARPCDARPRRANRPAMRRADRASSTPRR